ncbi:hypothetical protein J6590_077370 [Homalodisca vitripennis]|nr:hypothetical protein J6590_077370 [Homalodisca vitripennis]
MMTVVAILNYAYLCCRRVCIYHRCAESFWLADLNYKHIDHKGNKTAYDRHDTSGSQVNFNNAFYDDNLKSEYDESANSRSSFSSRNEDEDEEFETDESRSRYTFGLPMIGAITFFIANFLFFMFTILILWSYAQELKWSDLYDPQTSYVVENT